MRPCTCPPGHRRPGRPRGRRRLASLTVATAALAAVGLLPAGLAPGGAAPAGAASTAHPIMFGAVGNSRETVLAHERVLGHKLHGLRVYKNWDQQLFGGPQTWARDTGHTLFLSIDAKRSSGAFVTWSEVANARPGTRVYNDMLDQARQIKAFKAKVFIAYNHEPDTKWSVDAGRNPAEFVAAWRKLISVYRAAGVTNAEYVWVMTAYSFRRTDGDRAELYYPGDSYVDHIGADGYNWGNCRGDDGWADMAGIFSGQRDFGTKHPTKGLMVWEFSSTEDRGSPGRKARWLNDVEDLFKQPAWSQYKVLLTWEGRARAHRLDCQFDYLSSDSAKAAWKAIGTSPAYSASRVS